MDSPPRRLDPRHSRLLVLLAFLFGLGIHSIDQAMSFRAGPIPILVTAPLVAVLTYVYLARETGLGRVALLGGWGFVGSGVALLGVVVHSLGFRLPREITEPEMVAYDLALFLWFVVSLTAAYALAARMTDRTSAIAAVLLGPLLQLGWVLLTVLLVTLGLFA